MRPSIPGHASGDGTARHASRWTSHKRSHHDGLSLSILGHGLRVDAFGTRNDNDLVAALRNSLSNGINVIETSPVAADRRAEVLVGRGLSEAIAAGDVARDELVVITRVGFPSIDHEMYTSPAEVHDHLRMKWIDTGVTSAEDWVDGQCFSPDFLEASIDASRSALGLTTIDVVLIDMPEHMMVSGRPSSALRHRMRQVAVSMEQLVEKGLFVRWGVSTWDGFRQPSVADLHHPIDWFIAAAEATCAGDLTKSHHFTWVSAPFNLGMSEALMRPIESGANLSHEIQRCGLGWLVTAPLMHGHLVERLPSEVLEILGGDDGAALASLRFALSVPGSTLTIVGMSSTEHVNENASLLSEASLPEQDLFDAIESTS